MLYEALRVNVGLFFEFTIVKIKGPNKPIIIMIIIYLITQDVHQVLRSF